MKGKSKDCLGNALKNEIHIYKKKSHTYSGTQNQPKSKKYQSITHEKSLDSFLSLISLSKTELTTEESDLKVVEESSENSSVLSFKKEKDLLNIHQQLKSNLIIPRRPYWDSSTTPEELEKNEKKAFLDWRRKLASLQENRDLLLTPFERNIEVWRQLWRVIEKCDLIVQIVDARNPLLFRSKDLENYVEEMNKKNFLLINKADLMTLKQRKYWADYFKVKKIRYTFFSAILGENVNECHNNADIFNTCENINRIENNSNKNNLEDNILDNSENTDKNDNFFEDEETKIVTVNQLKDMFLKEMQILKNDKGYNINSFKKFHVGLVGYPNVGKSSTINSLIGKKKVSISSTPGRTKHFQTIHITDKLVLCDCPGLVFPNFSVTKADLVCSGVLPIDQLQDYIDPISLILHRISKHVLELTYGITMEAESVEDDETEIFTAENFLTKYSISRGIDKSTASRHIIKDYVSGKLLFCNPPPGIDPFVFNSEHFDSFKLSTRKYSQKNDLVNISSKKMLKNSEKECFELQESKNNKLSAFDRDFFCRNKLFLELNQKNKGLYYKKYIGSTAVHSYEYNFQNMLNKSKKHFKAYKRKSNFI